jgi:hypothetical protein
VAILTWPTAHAAQLDASAAEYRPAAHALQVVWPVVAM